MKLLFCIVALAFLSTDRVYATTAIDDDLKICERSRPVLEEIMRQLKLATCAQIKREDLLLIKRFYFVAGQNLKDFDLNGFAQLKDLTIDAWDAQFPPEIFRDLKSLEYLTINHIRFHALPNNIFTQLKAIKVIALRSGFLRTLPDAAFADLPNLEMVDLWQNEIQSLPPNAFQNSNSLKTIIVAYNQVGNLPDGIFNGLSKLETLDLGHNKIGVLPLDCFAGLVSLRDLGLDYNSLRTLESYIFQDLPSLGSLSLSNNPISNLVVENVFGPLVFSSTARVTWFGASFRLSEEKIDELRKLLGLRIYIS